MQSKKKLDDLIKKSRVHLYKPIQIAEILNHHREQSKLVFTKIETYRNLSKKWRDDVTKILVGNVSTSSQKFQDNLFDKNAIPPKTLEELSKINDAENGIVENYIYQNLKIRLGLVIDVLKYVKTSGIESFDLTTLLSKFEDQTGLKRSIDKAYEIITFSLFSTLVTGLNSQITLKINSEDKTLLSDFSSFKNSVLYLSNDNSLSAEIFRVGATNAADRGLDMWANFGPVIQIKHLMLDEKLVRNVIDGLTANQIILVCRDGEKKLIEKLTLKYSTNEKTIKIITFDDLKNWYDLCFSESYRTTLGKKVLSSIVTEFENEFPITTKLTSFMNQRGYFKKNLNGIWKETVNP
jgi:hypothetical protein